MASNKTKFITGLFVLSGLLLGAIAIIWLGASDIFLKGALYNVYFDESVQGLQVDSTVKYRGVEIGKVESIKVAPDNKLIEVVMKIDLSSDLQKNTYAQLRTAGITGIVFIELDRISPDIVVDFRDVPFSSNYPVIPSRRSETSRLLSDANTILKNVKAIDFKGVSEQIKNSARSLEVFMTDRRLTRIIANLESASLNLDRSAAGIKEKIDTFETESVRKDIAATLAETHVLIKSTRQEISATLAETRGLIISARQEIEAMQLPRQAAKAGEVIEALDKSSRSVALKLQDSAENLRTASESLKNLAESLKNNPSELIFSRPAPPRKPLE
ncbi:MAG: MlaD family protein [Syntrophales bacterium]|jgi:phospholipid/cholesterol/gamma-HCH transport system substrate-binding protein|nr:MlaD family protein [Syntrophales bacterium]